VITRRYPTAFCAFRKAVAGEVEALGERASVLARCAAQESRRSRWVRTLQTSAPSKGMPDDAAFELLETIGSRPSVLMVGTVEPRKRHLQALGAMERLWASNGTDVNFSGGWQAGLADGGRQRGAPDRSIRNGGGGSSGSPAFRMNSSMRSIRRRLFCWRRLAARALDCRLSRLRVHGVPVIARDSAGVPGSGG
jgi:hypothetical protein